MQMGSCCVCGVELMCVTAYINETKCESCESGSVKLVLPPSFANGIRERYKTACLSDFNTSEAVSMANGWIVSKSGEFALITGVKAGTGKTHLAVAMLREWFKINGEYGLFVCAVDMMQQLRGSFDDGTETESSLLLKWKAVKILCIDDIGTEKSSEYALSSLYQVINSRYMDMKPTIITTNLTSIEIKERQSERLFSRISSGIIITMSGDDLREKNRTVKQLSNKEQ
jgi:DNA replication protein DnaC